MQRACQTLFATDKVAASLSRSCTQGTKSRQDYGAGIPDRASARCCAGPCCGMQGHEHHPLELFCSADTPAYAGKPGAGSSASGPDGRALTGGSALPCPVLPSPMFWSVGQRQRRARACRPLPGQGVSTLSVMPRPPLLWSAGRRQRRARRQGAAPGQRLRTMPACADVLRAVSCRALAAARQVAVDRAWLESLLVEETRARRATCPGHWPCCPATCVRRSCILVIDASVRAVLTGVRLCSSSTPGWLEQCWCRRCVSGTSLARGALLFGQPS